ncbi:CheY-like protein [Rhizophagus irregularis]|uniref:CheY-like protein n=1 Tax=Rhizophagus irregularis TaxID=588596 RepID=A0A2N0PN04_9GLOM|nr:CheY-like protein [Rhizophagus irregularis]
MPAITCASNVLLPGSPITSPTTPTTATTSDSAVTSLSSGMASLSISTCIKTLIVDDNVITAKLLSKKLSKEFGHDTTCTISGKDALLKLSRETFDIIFMDIDMPELSGIETTLLIHAKNSNVLEQNRHIPIIAYTTNPCEDRFFEAGMTGWVGKPAKQMMVRQELERVYREARPSPPSSSSSSPSSSSSTSSRPS